MQNYDIGIIGAGVSGAFAAYGLAENSKAQVVVFELGRPPMKRRRQIEGWLGCLPNSDGKFYMNDLNKIHMTDKKTVEESFTKFKNIFNNVTDLKVTGDNKIKSDLNSKITAAGYTVTSNDFMQVFPREIHKLSKFMANKIEKAGNINFIFDHEIFKVHKREDGFLVLAGEREFFCKKLIISVGRSGWRWTNSLYKSLGIVKSNNIARFGIRAELSAQLLEDFNFANCTLNKQNLEVGPFCWGGTVIPEDHIDLAISAYRSNENRWKTDKVCFNIVGDRIFQDNGIDQTDRIAKLTFILSNERIVKEKISSMLEGKALISLIPEYKYLNDEIMELSKFIPDLPIKGYYHAPTIITSIPDININPDFSTDIEGMYVIGESAGINGLLAAGVMGTIVSTTIEK